MQVQKMLEPDEVPGDGEITLAKWRNIVNVLYRDH